MRGDEYACVTMKKMLVFVCMRACVWPRMCVCAHVCLCACVRAGVHVYVIEDNDEDTCVPASGQVLS